MSYAVGLQIKVLNIHIEDKVRLYEQVIHISTYHKINGVPLQRKKYLKQQSFKNRSGKWDPVTNLLKTSSALENNYLKYLKGVL